MGEYALRTKFLPVQLDEARAIGTGDTMARLQGLADELCKNIGAERSVLGL